MSPCSIQTLHADALFASALQRSDVLSRSKIRQAIAAALDGFGAVGCAGRVAQEFGDHPETAAARMHWASEMVAALGGQPVPGIWRIAAADGSAWAHSPTAALPQRASRKASTASTRR
jgi:hypothetical protein